MTDKPQDPLIASLMALAVSAAPLIQRARESGMFKVGSREEAASATAAGVPQPPQASSPQASSPQASSPQASSSTTSPPPTSPPAADAMGYAAQKAALQDIIVNQALKIAALEAEIARLGAARSKRAR